MAENDNNLPEKKTSKDVAAFLNKVAATQVTTRPGDRGRLIFALDATASRKPVWDHAAQIQGEMFVETSGLGGLEIQLSFFRGFGEFKVSPWLSEASELLRRMTLVFCAAGETQIGKVLKHAANETKKSAGQSGEE